MTSTASPRRMRATLATGTFLIAAACSGSGSDIGPRHAALPAGSCKVTVLDDEGRGVVAASVSLDGSARRATTGPNGRGDLFGDPRGRHLVHVDGAAAAAVDGDTFGQLDLAMTITGPDLPAAIHLPPLTSTPVTLTVGTQATASTVASDAGDVLTVPAGASVGVGGGAGEVVLRVGTLRPEHLPGDRPEPTTGPVLMGRGFCIDPSDFTCEPAATLDLPDDLGLGSAVASLYHLDPATGGWQVVSTLAFASAGRIAVAGVTSGGLYAFGSAVPGVTTVSGRVLDAAGVGVPGALVTIDGRPVTTDGSGAFGANGIAGTRVDASARDVAIEVLAGGSWLPARVATSATAVAGGVTDVGDLLLDTVPAGNLRVLQLERGAAIVKRKSAIGSANGDFASVTTGDADGFSLFEDVPAGWFGFDEGRPIDRERLYLTSAELGYLPLGTRWIDVYQHFERRSWYVGARSTRALVIDAFGGGLVRRARLVRGAVPGEGYVGESTDNAPFLVPRDFSGRATAVLDSQRDGLHVVDAFTVHLPNAQRIELPVQRALRGSLAAFDRHGIVAGTLLGADPARDQRVLSSRYGDAQDFWTEVVERGITVRRLPVDVDPATTHGAFRVGVAAAGGNLAATETSTSAGVRTLHRVGIAADVRPSEGEVQTRDLSLDLAATATFEAPGALVGIDPRIDLDAMTFALGLQQPSGRVVDVARGIGGNHAQPIGTGDLRFDLPALTGDLADHRWLLVLHGTAVDGGDALGYDALLTLPRAADGLPAADFRFPQFPDVQAPTAGAHVPVGGFTVQYTLPADALYGTIELRREVAGELRSWHVVVPPTTTEFTFVTLPPEIASSPLQSGDYELTVSAHRALGGPLVGSPTAYIDLTSYWYSIGTVERGVDAVTRRTFTITVD